jgi:hypothetical protein
MPSEVFMGYINSAGFCDWKLCLCNYFQIGIHEITQRAWLHILSVYAQHYAAHKLL